MIQWTTGNILESRSALIVVPVNCQPGILGAGLAKQAALRWPSLARLHAASGITPGGLCIVNPSRPIGLAASPSRTGQHIGLAGTKDHWRNPSRLYWAASILAALAALDPNVYPSLALSPIGCGLGGLHWAVVRRLIIEVAETAPVLTWEVYLPK